MQEGIAIPSTALRAGSSTAPSTPLTAAAKQGGLSRKGGEKWVACNLRVWLSAIP
jgi:hypothetical protein